MVKLYNKKSEMSYSIGVFTTIELLQNKPEHAAEVLLSPKGDRNVGVQKIKDICSAKNIKTRYDQKLIEKISGNGRTYAIGVFKKYETSLNPNSNHLVLINPSDMGNLGTICRTTLSFGILDIALISPAADIFDPKTVRASMGAIFQLNFEYLSSFSEYEKRFNHTKYAFMSDGETLLQKAKFTQPCSLIFGNEGAGLGDEFKNNKITSVVIPHNNLVDSLNLSIAVGVSLFEFSASTSGIKA